MAPGKKASHSTPPWKPASRFGRARRNARARARDPPLRRGPCGLARDRGRHRRRAGRRGGKDPRRRRREPPRRARAPQHRPALLRSRDRRRRGARRGRLAAAIFHRGVRHVRLPTTVLAQDDSGVGVKNAVNAFGPKNLVGIFAPPFAIVNDGGYVDTCAAGEARRHGRSREGRLDPRPQFLRTARGPRRRTGRLPAEYPRPADRAWRSSTCDRSPRRRPFGPGRRARSIMVIGRRTSSRTNGQGTTTARRSRRRRARHPLRVLAGHLPAGEDERVAASGRSSVSASGRMRSTRATARAARDPARPQGVPGAPPRRQTLTLIDAIGHGVEVHRMDLRSSRTAIAWLHGTHGGDIASTSFQDPKLTYCTNIHAGESLDAIRASLDAHVPRIKSRSPRTSPSSSACSSPASPRRSSSAGSARFLPGSTGETWRLCLHPQRFSVRPLPRRSSEGERLSPRLATGERVSFTPTPPMSWRRFSRTAASAASRRCPAPSSRSARAEGGRRPRRPSPSGCRAPRRGGAPSGQAHRARARARALLFPGNHRREARVLRGHLLRPEALTSCAILPGSRQRGRTDAASPSRHLLRRMPWRGRVRGDGRSLASPAGAGIEIPKIELSAAMRVPAINSASLAASLRKFNTGIYLHQVIVRDGSCALRRSSRRRRSIRRGQAQEKGGSIATCRYSSQISASSARPRTHFSRPCRVARRALSPHLEVETYTWDVLPRTSRPARRPTTSPARSLLLEGTGMRAATTSRAVPLATLFGSVGSRTFRPCGRTSSPQPRSRAAIRWAGVGARPRRHDAVLCRRHVPQRRFRPRHRRARAPWPPDPGGRRCRPPPCSGSASASSAAGSF